MDIQLPLTKEDEVRRVSEKQTTDERYLEIL